MHLNEQTAEDNAQQISRHRVTEASDLCKLETMFPSDYFKKRKAAKGKVEKEAQYLVLGLNNLAVALAPENVRKAVPEESNISATLEWP